MIIRVNADQLNNIYNKYSNIYTLLFENSENIFVNELKISKKN